MGLVATEEPNAATRLHAIKAGQVVSNPTTMSAPETATKFSSPSFSSVGGQVVGRSNRQAAAPVKEALKLRLDLNLEVEIAIQAKVNGDITLSLLE
ncbi:uncharacterized protein BT62DRAFT_1075661 [Guyanagaster necrorhizus]|uniref:Uncharacterized protein n=1 Tax=Guyanagaster necrorhizus TaxID=856835 RepID=A0A9P7VUL5_9AGAR|nr:uncharacterized protein BT62DRAFT_1075661 [Guyanagaster necrorhizus MCA 3950]KAG7446918.1 hypothetical protein BT62DRAFT_1075661 [Guyanagaster necrorhizus MCA 3950]